MAIAAQSVTTQEPGPPVKALEGQPETETGIVADSSNLDRSSTPPESDSATLAREYRSYKALVDRAVQVFGNDLTASRWLSMPSADLDGKVPLQVAQSLQYDAQKVDALFEPIFMRIEHGIYV